MESWTKLSMDSKRTKRLADLWSDFLDFPILPHEVSHMLKMADENLWRSDRERGALEPKEVQRFWELVETIGESKLNHSSDPSIIAINLNEFKTQCAELGLNAPEGRTIKGKLISSRQHPYVESSRVVYDPVVCKTFRCWIFKR